MTIVFWQDNKVHELDRSQSDRSLLDYLRCEAGVKSVKEGCAQGDCGACAVTVVQADPHHGLHIRVVNSCIKPLLSLDQSLVFCASDLPPEHPVVEAMLQSDASQCGFCTPGLIMRSIALIQ
ncbi:MAG: 2Fe-2S iron-sulfur cluster-binding protein, partial [Burkholderiaceae bacterium]